eukprot:gene7701-9908_t
MSIVLQLHLNIKIPFQFNSTLKYREIGMHKPGSPQTRLRLQKAMRFSMNPPGENTSHYKETSGDAINPDMNDQDMPSGENMETSEKLISPQYLSSEFEETPKIINDEFTRSRIENQKQDSKGSTSCKENSGLTLLQQPATEEFEAVANEIVHSQLAPMFISDQPILNAAGIGPQRVMRQTTDKKLRQLPLRIQHSTLSKNSHEGTSERKQSPYDTVLQRGGRSAFRAYSIDKEINSQSNLHEVQKRLGLSESNGTSHDKEFLTSNDSDQFAKQSSEVGQPKHKGDYVDVDEYEAYNEQSILSPPPAPVDDDNNDDNEEEEEEEEECVTFENDLKDFFYQTSALTLTQSSSFGAIPSLPPPPPPTSQSLDTDSRNSSLSSSEQRVSSWTPEAFV